MWKDGPILEDNRDRAKSGGAGICGQDSRGTGGEIEMPSFFYMGLSLSKSLLRELKMTGLFGLLHDLPSPRARFSEIRTWPAQSVIDLADEMEADRVPHTYSTAVEYLCRIGL